MWAGSVSQCMHIESDRVYDRRFSGHSVTAKCIKHSAHADRVSPRHTRKGFLILICAMFGL